MGTPVATQSDFTAAMAGDQDAWRRLCTGVNPRIRPVIRKIVGDDALEDVLQTTWMKVWKARSSFCERASVTTWIHKIAVNCALEYRRAERCKRKNSLLTDSLEQLREELNWEPKAATRTRLFEEYPIGVDKVLEILTGQYLRVAQLRLQDMSVHEMAKVMGVTPGAVKSYLHRVKGKVKEALGMYSPEMARFRQGNRNSYHRRQAKTKAAGV